MDFKSALKNVFKKPFYLIGLGLLSLFPVILELAKISAISKVIGLIIFSTLLSLIFIATVEKNKDSDEFDFGKPYPSALLKLIKLYIAQLMFLIIAGLLILIHLAILAVVIIITLIIIGAVSNDIAVGQGCAWLAVFIVIGELMYLPLLSAIIAISFSPFMLVHYFKENKLKSAFAMKSIFKVIKKDIKSSLLLWLISTVAMLTSFIPFVGVYFYLVFVNLFIQFYKQYEIEERNEKDD